MEKLWKLKVWELHKGSDLTVIDNNSQTLTSHNSRPKITTVVCVWVAWHGSVSVGSGGCACVFDLTVVFRCLGISYHLCCWCCCLTPTRSPLPQTAWGTRWR